MPCPKKRYAADDVLNLAQLAKALDLDPRTVKPLACELGGKRFGRIWKFRWGTVMESFNAHDTKRSGQCVDGQGQHQRLAGGEPDVYRSQEGAGMDSPTTKSWEVKTKSAIEGLLQQGLTLPQTQRNNSAEVEAAARKRKSPPPDPHGLREAFGLGR